MIGFKLLTFVATVNYSRNLGMYFRKVNRRMITTVTPMTMIGFLLGILVVCLNHTGDIPTV